MLRAEGQPKLVLGKRGNGHWVYFNTQDDGDCGTIIDFLLNRGLSFADIRARFAQPRTAAAPAAASFRDVWQRANPHPEPPWLIGRGITGHTLQAGRAAIRCDRQGRVLFAHRNRHRELTGFEIAPPDGPRRFATGGTRALFAFHAAAGAASLRALVVTESGLDALSIAQIERCPPDHAFLSTAGAPSRAQCVQIRHAADTLPNLEALVLAQDGDEAGDRQADAIRKSVVLPGRVRLERRRPPDNSDWNDIVRA